ncbi:GGDEF domain-containing protein [Paenibacillus sp.]|uniref:GGDEF domain-containing protein n=1 Tax=Paenibacillus sp. TaxID=58172 RepID=UPI002D5BCB0C|nr:diguanylate cyclase [Paenibacillus sp.]HZG54941.1 diguanylate cyclase [Paenibacillus sp.]
MGGSESFYRSMFDLSRSLFLQQTTDGVLKHIVTSLKGHFPEAVSQVYMSQDTAPTDPSVLPLVFRHDGNDLCTRAFMEGKPALGHPAEGADASGLPAFAAAVPLIGKQGVYGVLEVRASGSPLGPEQIDLLVGIGETAGAAFENAKLYEQSNLLVTELRLINEITKRLNQSLRVSEIFQYACQELIEVFRADFACILELDRKTRTFRVQATNMTEMLSDIFELDYGFAGLLHRTKEPVIVSDYAANSRVESKLMHSTGSRSLIAAPILVNEEVVGAVLVTHSQPSYFTYENYKLLLLLAGHIGLAIMKAQLHAELNRMVITDNLTGLYARRYLDEQVHSMQAKDVRGSLIVVDIDNFKQVNDTYGHQIGDQILKQVSGIVRSCIRDTDIAARWGGEELAIYLPQLTLEQTERVAERIRSRVEAETDPQVTVSCGIAEWSRSDEKISVESLFYKADMALYSAKHNGKNQYCIG